MVPVAVPYGGNRKLTVTALQKKRPLRERA
jgi:hypothetical protein